MLAELDLDDLPLNAAIGVARVWTTGLSNTLTVVDGSSSMVDGVVTLETPSTVWDGKALWLTSEAAPELRRIDPATLATVETVSLTRPARLLAGDENGLWLYAPPDPVDTDAP